MCVLWRVPCNAHRPEQGAGQGHPVGEAARDTGPGAQSLADIEGQAEPRALVSRPEQAHFRNEVGAVDPVPRTRALLACGPSGLPIHWLPGHRQIPGGRHVGHGPRRGGHFTGSSPAPRNPAPRVAQLCLQTEAAGPAPVAAPPSRPLDGPGHVGGRLEPRRGRAGSSPGQPDRQSVTNGQNVRLMESKQGPTGGPHGVYSAACCAAQRPGHGLRLSITRCCLPNLRECVSLY